MKASLAFLLFFDLPAVPQALEMESKVTHMVINISTVKLPVLVNSFHSKVPQKLLAQNSSWILVNLAGFSAGTNSKQPQSLESEEMISGTK